MLTLQIMITSFVLLISCQFLGSQNTNDHKLMSILILAFISKIDLITAQMFTHILDHTTARVERSWNVIIQSGSRKRQAYYWVNIQLWLFALTVFFQFIISNYIFCPTYKERFEALQNKDKTFENSNVVGKLTVNLGWTLIGCLTMWSLLPFASIAVTQRSIVTPKKVPLTFVKKPTSSQIVS